MIKVKIIWDFDAPIGQINSTFPYRFHFEILEKEIENVRYILDTSEEFGFKYTFAVTGFSAEKSVYPFDIRNLISEIYQKGHEIASHSWRHEWLPLLMEEQVIRTLERSKQVLEKCIGVEGAVKGFVPPHNRPMTWLSKGAFSPGDRGVYPFFKGANADYILRILEKLDYRWVRMVYKTPMDRLLRRDSYPSLKRGVYRHNAINIIPLHYNGFDKKAIDVVKRGLVLNRDVFICGHPSGLSRGGDESKENYDNFIKFLSKNNHSIVVDRVEDEMFQL